MSCRICLSEKTPSESVNIFTKTRNDERISDLIMNFAYIEVFKEDNLPDTICLACCKHLDDVYEFRDLIIKSDEQLKEIKNIVQSVNEEEAYCVESVLIEQKQLSTNGVQYQAMEQFECTESPTSFVSHDEVTRDTDENETVAQNESNGFKDSKINCPMICKPNLTNRGRTKTNKYKCDQCQSSFKNRYKLILHKTIHTGIFPHSCDICSKGFPTNWAMSVHRRIHFEERPFQCELCDKSFKSKSAQIIHRKIHLGIKSYQCKICSKQFVQMGGLRAHQYTHTNEKPLVCEYCGKHYTSKRALDRHSRIHKGTPNEPCPVCGKMYAGQVNVKIHMKTVHAEDRIRFPCEVCNKSFSAKSVLKIHMRIHEGVKPFSCDLCGKSFRQASVATLHKRVHTGETPFSCTFCNKKFAYKHHLKKHMEKDHVKKEFQLQCT